MTTSDSTGDDMPKLSSHPCSDLVYDIGMHRGEDTAYYLAKGYRVLGFEAHPELAKECRERFVDAIENGDLTIIEGAIAEQTEGSVTFFIDNNSQWGSIDPAWVEKKQILRPKREISVPVVDLAICMQQYGVPHYMKIDIEGADRHCIEVLRRAPGMPDYISMEAELFDFELLLAELEQLEQLGYRDFAVVRQGEHGEISTLSLPGEPLTYRFPQSSSGPFGEDLGNAWGSRRAAVRHYRRVFRRRTFGRLLMKTKLAPKLLSPVWNRSPRFKRFFLSYYDTHAKR
jgi:FkbM family methyltransferase